MFGTDGDTPKSSAPFLLGRRLCAVASYFRHQVVCTVVADRMV